MGDCRGSHGWMGEESWMGDYERGVMGGIVGDLARS